MSTKNKKSNCDKNQKLKLWQSSTTLVFTRLINLNWNKSKEKTDFEEEKKTLSITILKKILNFF